MRPAERAHFSIEIPVAWGDMDALGHVNNTVYLRWFESARIAYFERTALHEAMSQARRGPILARQAIDYRRPLSYPDRVRTAVSVTRIGTTSFTMSVKITSLTHDAVAAEGEGVLVLVDYATGEKIRISDELRQLVLALEGR